MYAVLEPIPTKGLTSADVPALMKRIEEAMLKTLRSISDDPPRDVSGKDTLAAVPASLLNAGSIVEIHASGDRADAPVMSVGKGAPPEDSDEDAVLVDKPSHQQS